MRFFCSRRACVRAEEATPRRAASSACAGVVDGQTGVEADCGFIVGVKGAAPLREARAQAREVVGEGARDIVVLGGVGGDVEEAAAGAVGELRAKYEEQLPELIAKLKDGEAKLDEVIASADHLWEEFKDEAEEKWADVQEGFKDSLAKVKSFFS